MSLPAAIVLSDLDTMLQGDTAVITHGGVVSTVVGTYENEYAEIDVGTMVQSSHPAFYCKTTDVPNADNRDTLVVTSVLYNIAAVSYKTNKVQKNPPDLGPGITRFVLKI
jgi:hypothetical protein